MRLSSDIFFRLSNQALFLMAIRGFEPLRTTPFSGGATMLPFCVRLPYLLMYYHYSIYLQYCQ